MGRVRQWVEGMPGWLGWAIACTAAPAGVALPSGYAAAAFGGFLGALLADAVVVANPWGWHDLRGRRLLGLIICVVLAICGIWIYGNGARLLPVPLDVLFAADMVALCLAAILLIGSVRVVAHMFLPAVLEAFLAFLLALRGMAAQRGAARGQAPYWLMDTFAGRGWLETSTGLSIPIVVASSALTLLVFVLVLFSRPVRRGNRAAPWLARILTFCLAIMACCAALLLPQLAPPPPPPSSPPPEIASVRFLGYPPDSSAPVRQGVFFFRTAALSQLEGVTLSEAPARDENDVLDAIPTYTWTCTNPPTGQACTTRVQILHYDSPSRPFLLPRSTALTPVPVRGHARIRLGYNIEWVAPPFIDMSPDNSLLQRYGFSATGLPERIRPVLLAIPPDAVVTSTVAKLLATVPQRQRESSGKRAAAVIHYVNSYWSLDEKGAAVTDSAGLSRLMLDERRGSSATLAQGTVLLLRAAGIPARIGKGYRKAYRPGPDSGFVIEIGDAAEWPELHLDGFGWLPVLLTPKTVLSSSPVDAPKPPEALVIAKEPEPKPEPKSRGKDPEKKEPTPGNPATTQGRQIVSALVVIGFLMIFPSVWRRGIAPATGRPKTGRPKRVLIAATDLLAILGWRRRYAEERESFAARVCKKDPELGGVYRDILYVIRNTDSCGPLPKLLRRLECVVTRRCLGVQRGNKELKQANMNPWRWWGADRPQPSQLKREVSDDQNINK